jgi:UDP-glucose 4-epimerase
MKCLVFGGGGFLGSHLCDALLTEGHAVRVFDRPNLERYRSFLAEEDVEWVEGDFTNQEEVARVVPGCDIIYHLVSTTLPKSSNDNPVYDIETNVVSTLHLLDVARKSKVKKIIFISSGGTVYGVPGTVPIKECHPTNPICSYGISKLTIEKYLHLYYTLYGLDYSVLRLANPYGERQRTSAAQGAVAVFLHKALKNESIEIWGDGSVVRDYIYVTDATDAMVKVLSYTGEQKLFNLGSGQGQSLNDILDAIENVLGRPVTRSYVEGRALDVPVSVLDIERAIEDLQWDPRVDFRGGLERTVEWIKASVMP